MAGIGNIGKMRINEMDGCDNELTEDDLTEALNYYGVSSVDDLPWDEILEVRRRILDPDSDISESGDLTWEELKELYL